MNVFQPLSFDMQSCLLSSPLFSGLSWAFSFFLSFPFLIPHLLQPSTDSNELPFVPAFPTLHSNESRQADECSAANSVSWLLLKCAKSPTSVLHLKLSDSKVNTAT